MALTVREALDRFLDEGSVRAQEYGDDYIELWRALSRLTAGGKGLRPTLLVSAFHAYGGLDVEVAHRAAAALELLHTGLLIHDDLIDGDVVRRGAPNVSGTFSHRASTRDVAPEGCATYALTAGILAGDLALVGATRALALCGAPAPVTRRLLDLLQAAVEVSAAGELADVALSLDGDAVGYSMQEVLVMEERKTAIYSFQLPLQAGAVLAGAGEEIVERLGEVGRLAGIGFQLVDDLLGAFGDETRTGKSSWNDLREGKATPLMAFARTTSSWPEIAGRIGNPDLDEHGARAVRALLIDCGSRAHVEHLAGLHLARALDLARELGVAHPVIVELTRLTAQVLAAAA